MIASRPKEVLNAQSSPSHEQLRNIAYGVALIGIGTYAMKELTFAGFSMGDMKRFFSAIVHWGSDVPVCGAYELVGKNETRSLASSPLKPGTQPWQVPIKDQPHKQGKMSKSERNIVKMQRECPQRAGRFFKQ